MTATVGLERLHEKILIGGEWVNSLGDDWLEVENPATEEIIGQIPDATTADADVAIAAAVTAFESGEWSKTTPA